MLEDDIFKKFSDALDKRNNARFSFIKQVLLLATTLFGILIALHKYPSLNCTHRIIFSLSLVLLSLSILFLIIASHGLIEVYTRLMKHLQEELQSPFLSQIANEPSYGIAPSFYKYAELIGYTLFSLSLISLTVYAILVS